MSQSAALKRINPVHQRLADWLLEHGGNSKGWSRRAAEAFGYSQPYLSTIYHSDAFQDYYQARCAEFGQAISIGLAEKVNGLAGQALDVLAERLVDQPDMPTSQVLEIADKALKHAGFGGPKAGPAQVNNYILSSEDLASAQARMRGAQPKAIELEVVPTAAKQSDTGGA
jgi:hypothetical protein